MMYLMRKKGINIYFYFLIKVQRIRCHHMHEEKKKKKKDKNNLLIVYDRADFRKRFRFKFGSCILST